MAVQRKILLYSETNLNECCKTIMKSTYRIQLILNLNNFNTQIDIFFENQKFILSYYNYKKFDF